MARQCLQLKELDQLKILTIIDDEIELPSRETDQAQYITPDDDSTDDGEETNLLKREEGMSLLIVSFRMGTIQTVKNNMRSSNSDCHT